ncbi:PAS domain-containing protein [uncultured Methylobacterium sp.]|uniref:PAS domain-containing protein n=1 Tax=uncultured Methylobacterium sp. TaxID=157278 RepID=UPI0035CAE76B
MRADTIDRTYPASVDLSAALTASGVVGTWAWSARPDRCTLDAGAAEVLAGDHTIAGLPLPLEQAKARVHPDDRPELFRHFKRLRRCGGLFVAEYRTVSATGRVRRILDRGRLVRSETGVVAHGHGIIIDVTESDLDLESFAATVLPDPVALLEAAADHAIACREAIEQLDNSELRLIANVLLLSLGQHLAKVSTGSNAGRAH